MVNTILHALLNPVPLVVVAAVGIWSAVSLRTRWPRTARWALAGFASVLLASVLVASMQWRLWSMTRPDYSGPSPSSQMGQVALLSMLAQVALVLGVAMLARAIFVERR